MGGLAARPPSCRRIIGLGQKLRKWESHELRVLLSTYGSRGDVEPPVTLAARLREFGAEVRVCAPPDEESAQRPAGVGLVPAGPGDGATAAAKLLDTSS
ncbi:hypothetical protein GCM10010518_18570 [Kitasatospora cinereorecta]